MKYKVSFDLELKKNPYKGKYIAFEGIDGSGKTTQANILKTHFAEKKKNVVLTKEPTTKPPVGSLIHSFIKGRIKMPPVSIQYLFAADRQIHQKEIIEPVLEEGDLVISDRTFWSSVAYGILDKQENSEELNNKEVLLVSESILSMYHQFIAPDITFYIKVKPATAMKRLVGMKRKKEYYETLGKLKNIEAGYEWLAKKFLHEIAVIDGEKSIEEVSAQILSNLKLT